jgi:probable phosphoglycerate mutase
VPTTHPVPASPATPSLPRVPPAAAPPPFSMHDTFLLSQPAATELALVRHGQQRWPTTPVFTPSEWVDPPLSDIGQRQADVVGRAFADEHVDVVVCSHLTRAHETARAIASHHGLEPLVLPDLREVETYRDLDDGVSPAEALAEPYWRGVQERFPTERRWDLVPFGESSGELRHRVVSTVEGLLALHPESRLVVVCHGGVINAYLAHLLGISEDMFFLPAHASVSRVRRLGPRRALHSLNDRHHLSAAAPELLTY